MDPILTEIMKNRFTAIVEEAATVAYRIAHTTFVKQTQDYQVAIADEFGNLFAYPLLSGDTGFAGETISGLIDCFPRAELRPGDVLISNDPYRTAGLVTHIMDIHMVRPIFFGEELVGFAWSFIHASDVGGAVPGSISPDLTEVFQEGLRLRPMKLVRAGVANEDLINVLRDNSRIGDAVYGDLEAMMAAMRLVDTRVNALCGKLGITKFRQGIKDVLAYGELKARQIISDLKDGVYEFADYVEGAPNAIVLVKCRLTIKGEEAEIDYSGSSAQIEAALNFTTGSRTHPFLCLALTKYFQTVAPSMPLNSGMLRPIRAKAPKGTVINAEFPAASGNRWVMAMRAYDALVGCLNQASETGIAACGAGQAGVIFASWRDKVSGTSKVCVVEPFSGGSGGRSRLDGVAASDTLTSCLKSTPVELVEVETPLVVRRYELIDDRFGHGRFRGGAASRIELECTSEEARITVRGLDRFRFQPWGLLGGHAGHCGRIIVLRRAGSIEEIGRINVLTLREGDRLVLESSSGGGFGDPMTREPGAVLRDVLDGFITRQVASDVYGVHIADAEIDMARTAALRAKANGDPGHLVDFGNERRRYEQIWPVASSAAFANAILDAPAGVRSIIAELARNDLGEAEVSISPSVATAAVRSRLAYLAEGEPTRDCGSSTAARETEGVASS